jgi:hypothetical protein
MAWMNLTASNSETMKLREFQASQEVDEALIMTRKQLQVLADASQKFEQPGLVEIIGAPVRCLRDGYGVHTVSILAVLDAWAKIKGPLLVTEINRVQADL